MKQLFLSLIIIVLLGAAGISAQDLVCGDANYDEAIDLGDAATVFDYVILGGPMPPIPDLAYANFDGNDHLTIRDVQACIKYVYSEWYLVCPVAPPYVPTADPDMVLYYRGSVPANESEAVVTMQCNSDILAYQFPVRLRVEGAIPTLDSIIVEDDDEYLFNGSCIYPGTGECVFGVARVFGSVFSRTNIARIYVSIPPAANNRDITLEWATLSPLQAPEPDSSITPMVVSWYLHGVVPTLTTECCFVPGDANHDGECNVGDAIFIINGVFKEGSDPYCFDEADANGDCAYNVGDAVFIIGFVFKGGPFPVCGCAGWGR